MFSRDGNHLNLLLRHIELNRGGAPDRSNTITPTPQNLMNLELTYVRFSRFGRLEFGAGFDHLEDKVTDETDREVRGFFKWTVGRDALQ